MTKRTRILLIAAICAVGAAGAGTALGLLFDQSAPNNATPHATTLPEERNTALMQLAAAADVQAELLVRQKDPGFVEALTTKNFSFRDLADLAGKREQVHAAIADTRVDERIRFRLAQLAIMGRHHLLASMADWSRAYRIIYQSNSAYNVAGLPAILDEYSIVIQKYAPLSFDEAFAGWNLSVDEQKAAQPLYEAAVKQHGKPTSD